MSNLMTTADQVRSRRARRDAARSGATATGVVDLHRQLLDAAFELAGAHETLPAGSVLRCFARSVQRARLLGVEPSRLPEEARRLAEASLRERATQHRNGRRGGMPAVA